VASVARALWAARKQRHEPEDPEADWHRAEQLIEELRSHRCADFVEPDAS
jgi:predicted component of type VI protein secretion system